MDRPDVTVVVVTWQQRDLALRCLASLAEQTVPCRVLLVDNGSTDDTSEAVLAAYPSTDVLRLPANLGFAGGVDAAMAQLRTRFVALLNNDAVADPGWLAASLDALRDPRVAAATAKLLFDDGSGTVNNTGVVLLATGYGADRGLGLADDERFADPVEVFGFSGGAAVLRTMAVRAVGGFAAEWFMYYEDTDLSWRLRLAGWRVVYAPGALVWHRHAASSDSASAFFAFQNERNRLLMLIRNAPVRTAVGGAGRFVLTTGSLVAKRLLRRDVPPAAVFDPRLRIGVGRDVVRRLPRTLRQRRRVPRARSRGAVLSQWSGVAQRPLERAR